MKVDGDPNIGAGVRDLTHEISPTDVSYAPEPISRLCCFTQLLETPLPA